MKKYLIRDRNGRLAAVAERTAAENYTMTIRKMNSDSVICVEIPIPRESLKPKQFETFLQCISDHAVIKRALCDFDLFISEDTAASSKRGS